MIQVEFILKNKDIVINKLRKRRFEKLNILDDIIVISQERKNTQTVLDNKRNEINKVTKEIALKPQAIDQLKQELVSVKSDIKDLESKLRDLKNQELELLTQIPNLPHDSVPEGKGAQDNNIVYESNVSNRKYNESLLSHIFCPGL
ncbi:MAG: hypothetical protein ACQPRJ_05790 [Solitalea-like symbiont of Acarus siro]